MDILKYFLYPVGLFNYLCLRISEDSAILPPNNAVKKSEKGNVQLLKAVRNKVLLPFELLNNPLIALLFFRDELTDCNTIINQTLF
jgi:hypothetical protein